MTEREKIFYKLGLSLKHKDGEMEVYINHQNGFDIQVDYFFPGKLRIFVTAKFSDTNLKIHCDFPIIHPIGIRPEAEYMDLKQKITECLSRFSNILVSKSNEFTAETKRIESLQHLNF